MYHMHKRFNINNCRQVKFHKILCIIRIKDLISATDAKLNPIKFLIINFIYNNINYCIYYNIYIYIYIYIYIL